MRNLWAGAFRLLGTILALLSCVPMVAMLPAGFATALAFLGFTAPWLVAWATPLASFAPPLFVLSVVFLVIGNLRCGWQPASLAGLGGVLIYLAMFVFVTPMTIGTTTGMPGMAPSTTSKPTMLGLTNASMFYMGLLLIAVSFGFVLWRRWRKTCSPINPLAFFRTTRPN